MTLNWKHLRQFLWSSKERVFTAGDCESVTEFGPLSFLAQQNGDAALLRLVPRFPGHTDIELVRMAAPGTPAPNGDGDRIAAGLRDIGDTIAAAPLGVLERPFYDWYWSTLSPTAN